MTSLFFFLLTAGQGPPLPWRCPSPLRVTTFSISPGDSLLFQGQPQSPLMSHFPVLKLSIPVRLCTCLPSFLGHSRK